MKATKRIILFLIVLTVILPIVSYAQNQPRTTEQAIELARSYLLNAQNPDGSIGDTSTSDWAAMALGAAATNDSRFSNLKTYITAQASRVDKNSATELERTILALSAVGINPYSIANRNLVDELKALASGGQIGSPNFINDDIFAILAFRATGQDPASEPFKSTIEFVKRNQLANGGFNDRVGGQEADIDITAVATVALASYTNTGTAKNFLVITQNSDGGFPSRAGSSSNVASTAWTMWTIGLNQRAVEYLVNQQQANGSFGSILLTSYSLHALTGKSLPVGFVNPPAGEARPTGGAPAAIVQPTPTPAPSVSTPSVVAPVAQPITQQKPEPLQERNLSTAPGAVEGGAPGMVKQKPDVLPVATPGVHEPVATILLIAGDYPKETLAQTSFGAKTVEPPQLSAPKREISNLVRIVLPIAVIALGSILVIILRTPTELIQPHSAPS